MAPWLSLPLIPASFHVGIGGAVAMYMCVNCVGNVALLTPQAGHLDDLDRRVMKLPCTLGIGCA